MKYNISTGKSQSSKFDKVLSEATNFDVIKWIRSYNGDNQFICSCRGKMLENHPLTNNQFLGLKKCYAYFLINKPAKKLSAKQSEKIDTEIEGLICENH